MVGTPKEEVVMAPSSRRLVAMAVLGTVFFGVLAGVALGALYEEGPVVK
jgi:hypothetical protein